MAGSPKKRANRERAQTIMNKQGFFEHVFSQIADGVSLPNIAAELAIPYKQLWTKINTTPELNSAFQQARKAHATWQEAQINRLADNVEVGITEPQAAKISIDARKWLASRSDPGTYGERTQHDVKIQSIHTLHLEAHADLAQRMKQIHDQGETIEHQEDDETPE